MSQLTIARPPASAGLFWIKEGWRLFKPAPVPWMGMTALAFMVIIGMSMIPVVGHFIVELLSPFMVAGYLSASRAAQEGEPVTFIHLGAGVHAGRNALFQIGLTYMVSSILIFAIVQFATGVDPREMMQQMQDPSSLSPVEANRLVNAFLPAMTLAGLLFTPLLMATWFSPGLALFDGFPAGRAMWWSLWACLVNWRPLLYYSLVLGLVGMVALIMPFGLGMLVFLPLTLASTYVAYRMVFVPEEAGMTESAE